MHGILPRSAHGFAWSCPTYAVTGCATRRLLRRPTPRTAQHRVGTQSGARASGSVTRLRHIGNRLRTQRRVGPIVPSASGTAQLREEVFDFASSAVDCRRRPRTAALMFVSRLARLHPPPPQLEWTPGGATPVPDARARVRGVPDELPGHRRRQTTQVMLMLHAGLRQSGQGAEPPQQDHSRRRSSREPAVATARSEDICSCVSEAHWCGPISPAPQGTKHTTSAT